MRIGHREHEQEEREVAKMSIQTQAEWEEEMSVKIISFLQQELYLDLRFLKLALSALQPKADDRLHTFATDGAYLYYSKEQLLRVFQSNSRFLERAYLHSILHCIFSHLWIAGNRDRRLWNLACDIVTEYTIDEMDKPSTRRILSWSRQQVYGRLRQEEQGISAAVVYRCLPEWMKACGTMEELEKEFYTDDHSYWPTQKQQKQNPQMSAVLQKKWQKLARQTHMEQQKSDGETAGGEELLAGQIEAAKGRRSYHDFLKKFSRLQEELHCDMDEFDLNYYSYGLRLYGNLPLIEPLESREVYQIQEFVIAIDTSYSTSGELVSDFLKETFRILTQKSRFGVHSRILVIQCDNEVRRVEEITNEAQLTQFFAQFTIAGGGGTDFRPVFTYVNRLIEDGEIRHLNGLLYFTDGLGIYPKKRPDYKTAFLFLKEYDETKVPPWAMRMKLEPEELEGEY